MNIYFACSITGGRDFERVYQDLVRALLADGHTIPIAHLAESSVASTESEVGARAVYEREYRLDTRL
jgi:hypothetical protein